MCVLVLTDTPKASRTTLSRGLLIFPTRVSRSTSEKLSHLVACYNKLTRGVLTNSTVAQSAKLSFSLELRDGNWKNGRS